MKIKEGTQLGVDTSVKIDGEVVNQLIEFDTLTQEAVIYVTATIGGKTKVLKDINGEFQTAKVYLEGAKAYNRITGEEYTEQELLDNCEHHYTAEDMNMRRCTMCDRRICQDTPEYQEWLNNR